VAKVSVFTMVLIGGYVSCLVRSGARSGLYTIGPIRDRAFSYAIGVAIAIGQFLRSGSQVQAPLG